MLSVEALSCVLGLNYCHLLFPPQIAVVIPVDLVAAALNDKNVLNAWAVAVGQSLVNGWL